jgi:hypothetical protein
MKETDETVPASRVKPSATFRDEESVHRFEWPQSWRDSALVAGA